MSTPRRLAKLPQRKPRLAAKSKATPAAPAVTPATATVSSTVSFAQVLDAQQAMMFGRQLDMEGDEDLIDLRMFMKEALDAHDSAAGPSTSSTSAPALYLNRSPGDTERDNDMELCRGSDDEATPLSAAQPVIESPAASVYQQSEGEEEIEYHGDCDEHFEDFDYGYASGDGTRVVDSRYDYTDSEEEDESDPKSAADPESSMPPPPLPAMPPPPVPSMPPPPLPPPSRAYLNKQPSPFTAHAGPSRAPAPAVFPDSMGSFHTTAPAVFPGAAARASATVPSSGPSSGTPAFSSASPIMLKIKSADVQAAKQYSKAKGKGKEVETGPRRLAKLPTRRAKSASMEGGTPSPGTVETTAEGTSQPAATTLPSTSLGPVAPMVVEPTTPGPQPTSSAPDTATPIPTASVSRPTRRLPTRRSARLAALAASSENVVAPQPTAKGNQQSVLPSVPSIVITEPLEPAVADTATEPAAYADPYATLQVPSATAPAHVAEPSTGPLTREYDFSLLPNVAFDVSGTEDPYSYYAGVNVNNIDFSTFDFASLDLSEFDFSTPITPGTADPYLDSSYSDESTPLTTEQFQSLYSLTFSDTPEQPSNFLSSLYPPTAPSTTASSSAPNAPLGAVSGAQQGFPDGLIDPALSSPLVTGGVGAGHTGTNGDAMDTDGPELTPAEVNQLLAITNNLTLGPTDAPLTSDNAVSIVADPSPVASDFGAELMATNTTSTAETGDASMDLEEYLSTLSLTQLQQFSTWIGEQQAMELETGAAGDLSTAQVDEPMTQSARLQFVDATQASEPITLDDIAQAQTYLDEHLPLSTASESIAVDTDSPLSITAVGEAEAQAELQGLFAGFGGLSLAAASATDTAGPIPIQTDAEPVTVVSAPESMERENMDVAVDTASGATITIRDEHSAEVTSIAVVSHADDVAPVPETGATHTTEPVVTSPDAAATPVDNTEQPTVTPQDDAPQPTADTADDLTRTLHSMRMSTPAPDAARAENDKPTAVDETDAAVTVEPSSHFTVDTPVDTTTPAMPAVPDSSKNSEDSGSPVDKNTSTPDSTSANESATVHKNTADATDPAAADGATTSEAVSTVPQSLDDATDIPAPAHADVDLLAEVEAKIAAALMDSLVERFAAFTASDNGDDAAVEATPIEPAPTPTAAEPDSTTCAEPAEPVPATDADNSVNADAEATQKTEHEKVANSQHESHNDDESTDDEVSSSLEKEPQTKPVISEAAAASLRARFRKWIVKPAEPAVSEEQQEQSEQQPEQTTQPVGPEQPVGTEQQESDSEKPQELAEKDDSDDDAETAVKPVISEAAAAKLRAQFRKWSVKQAEPSISAEPQDDPDPEEQPEPADHQKLEAQPESPVSPQQERSRTVEEPSPEKSEDENAASSSEHALANLLARFQEWGGLKQADTSVSEEALAQHGSGDAVNKQAQVSAVTASAAPAVKLRDRYKHWPLKQVQSCIPEKVQAKPKPKGSEEEKKLEQPEKPEIGNDRQTAERPAAELPETVAADLCAKVRACETGFPPSGDTDGAAADVTTGASPEVQGASTELNSEAGTRTAAEDVSTDSESDSDSDEYVTAYEGSDGDSDSDDSEDGGYWTGSEAEDCAALYTSRGVSTPQRSQTVVSPCEDEKEEKKEEESREESEATEKLASSAKPFIGFPTIESAAWTVGRWRRPKPARLCREGLEKLKKEREADWRASGRLSKRSAEQFSASAGENLPGFLVAAYFPEAQPPKRLHVADSPEQAPDELASDSSGAVPPEDGMLIDEDLMEDVLVEEGELEAQMDEEEQMEQEERMDQEAEAVEVDGEGDHAMSDATRARRSGLDPRLVALLRPDSAPLHAVRSPRSTSKRHHPYQWRGVAKKATPGRLRGPSASRTERGFLARLTLQAVKLLTAVGKKAARVTRRLRRLSLPKFRPMLLQT